jgi:hypothetical protein
VGGIYEVGAMAALAEALEGVDFTAFDIYVGVSSGAFIVGCGGQWPGACQVGAHAGGNDTTRCSTPKCCCAQLSVNTCGERCSAGIVLVVLAPVSCPIPGIFA